MVLPSLRSSETYLQIGRLYPMVSRLGAGSQIDSDGGGSNDSSELNGVGRSSRPVSRRSRVSWSSG